MNWTLLRERESLVSRNFPTDKLNIRDEEQRPQTKAIVTDRNGKQVEKPRRSTRERKETETYKPAHDKKTTEYEIEKITNGPGSQ